MSSVAKRIAGLSLIIDHIARNAERMPDVVAIRCGRQALTYAMLPFLIAAKAARIHSADPSSTPVHIGPFDLPHAAVSALALRQLGRTLITTEPGGSPTFRKAALADSGATISIDRHGLRLLRPSKRPPHPRVAHIHYTMDRSRRLPPLIPFGGARNALRAVDGLHRELPDGPFHRNAVLRIASGLPARSPTTSMNGHLSTDRRNRDRSSTVRCVLARMKVAVRLWWDALD